MEPRFQTSFIPKKPIITPVGSQAGYSGGMNIFSTIATVSFILTLIMSVSVFLYKNLLTTQVAQADKELTDPNTQAAIEPDKIQELIDVNSRISATKQLLEKHVVVSQVLSLMQDIALKKIKFSEFTYSNGGSSNNSGGTGVGAGDTSNSTNVSTGPTISINAEAQSYNAVAEQSNVFAQNNFIISPQFSDFMLSDNGVITFRIFAGLNPKLVSFKEEVQNSTQ